MGGARPITDLDERRILAAYPEVRRFAFVVADVDVDPEDLVHEALVGLLSAGAIDAVVDLGAYLRRAVINAAANQRRSLGRRRRATSRLGAGETGRFDVLPSDLADLMHLPPLDRAVLYLFVVERRSHREVGELVELSEEAVRARVSRALKKLRIELNEEVGHGNAG